MRAIGNVLNRLLVMIHPRRARKRKRVTMRYLMLLSMAATSLLYIDIFKPIA
jgi:hypothetical protein